MQHKELGALHKTAPATLSGPRIIDAKFKVVGEQKRPLMGRLFHDARPVIAAAFMAPIWLAAVALGIWLLFWRA